jgi:hypothetical protein
VKSKFILVSDRRALRKTSFNAITARSLKKALSHWFRHSHYHTTEYCHIGRGNHIFTQQGNATFVNSLTVSQNIHMLIHVPQTPAAPHVHNLYFFVTLHDISLVKSSDYNIINQCNFAWSFKSTRKFSYYSWNISVNSNLAKPKRDIFYIYPCNFYVGLFKYSPA